VCYDYHRGYSYILCDHPSEDGVLKAIHSVIWSSDRWYPSVRRLNPSAVQQEPIPDSTSGKHPLPYERSQHTPRESDTHSHTERCEHLKLNHCTLHTDTQLAEH
jgi:hypothetical protein